MSWRAVWAVVVVLSCLADCRALGLVGEGGVGISTPADSVQEVTYRSPSCPSWESYHGTDRFWKWPINTYKPWIDVDVDLLIDGQFGSNPLVNDVTPSEARRLLSALNEEQDNRFGWTLTDLAMAYGYFAESTAYDSLGEHHISLYPVCLGDETLDYERDHLDLYLTPARQNGLTSCGAVTPVSWSCRDADEDPPGNSNYPEWYNNAVSVTDNSGNSSADSTMWPRVAAAGAIHEFTHVCWNSNSSSYGQHGGDGGGDYNELLACASEYLSVPPDTILGGDFRYIYSVLHEPSTQQACWDPCKGRSPTLTANAQRYHLWRLFGAYLGYQFHDPDPDSLQRSLISRWARNVTDWGNDDIGMERTFCGLARILDDDEEFEPILGHETGADRVSQMFANYGIARWVDYPIFASPPDSQPYYFGPDFSPYHSAGQFNKHDNDPEWGYNALWEYVMPPEFTLDEDNLGVWTSYPAPCPHNSDSLGWADTFHPHNVQQTGIYHGCVPVQLDLWGSNYLVFRADTLDFGWGSADTLVVQFSWVDTNYANLMNQRVELWLSVLRYSASIDNLFLRGDRLRLPVTTERYYDEAETTTVKVPAFRRDANEAVVIVLTLVAADYDGTGTAGCMSRTHLAGEPCVDLHYSYRFRVQSNPPEPPGGGCPFVSSLGSSGYEADNNVLAPAWPGGDDVLDAYLLRQRPEVVDGMYRLRLTETEDERSRFDGIELLAIDHAAGTNVAVFADGTIGTYRVTDEPVACTDQDGNDILDLVLRSDGENAAVKAGGWLDVVFRSEGATRSGGGIGEDGGPGQKIEQPGGGRGDTEEGTLSLASQCYRANPCVSILDMPEGVVPDDGLITIRLTAPTDYRLDRLFMTEPGEDPISITRCALSDAQHSQSASCMSALAADDGEYASLAQGDTIDLVFSVPKTATEERDFVLLARGGEVSRSSGEPPDQPEAAAATISPAIAPNPFNPSTRISFNVPGTGGHVVVGIYNMAGKLVRRLADAEMPSGQRTVTWDGRGDRGEVVSSGVYFCRIETPGQSDQKKLVLLK